MSLRSVVMFPDSSGIKVLYNIQYELGHKFPSVRQSRYLGPSGSEAQLFTLMSPQSLTKSSSVGCH